MIKLLKSNNPINLLLMFVIMALLWGFKFLYMPLPTEPYEYQSYFSCTAVNSVKWNYISAISAFIIYYLFSLFIIKTNNDLVIIESAHQTPGIFFVLLTGMFINAQRILPEMIAGIIIYIAIIILMYSYKKQKALGYCFDAGLLFGAAMLLVSKFIFFYIILFLTLIIIRPFKWRELLSIILGSLCVFVIVFSFIYLYGDSSKFVSNILSGFLIRNPKMGNITNLYIFLPIVILSLLSIIAKFALNKSQNIFTRKAQNILILFLLSALAYFILPLSSNETIVVLYAPLSLLLSNLFVRTKRLDNIILFLLTFSGIIFLQIFQYYIFY